MLLHNTRYRRAAVEWKPATSTQNSVTAFNASKEQQVMTRSSKHSDQQSEDEEKKRRTEAGSSAQETRLSPSSRGASPSTSHHVPSPYLAEHRQGSASLNICSWKYGTYDLLKQEKLSRAERRFDCANKALFIPRLPRPINHGGIPLLSCTGRTPRPDREP